MQQMKSLKKELTNYHMKEDMRHNYLYHVLFDNFSSKEKLIGAKLDSRTPAIYPTGQIVGDELRQDSEHLLPGGEERIYMSTSKLSQGGPDDPSSEFDIGHIRDLNSDRIGDI